MVKNYFTIFIKVTTGEIMSSNNQTNTRNNSNFNSISDNNYLKKFRTKTKNYGIATILFFISGLGLNSIDDYKKPNHFKKILNYTKPIVIFLSMPFGILTAINSIKLISAQDFPKFYAKPNVVNYYQKPSQIDRNFIPNSSKISSHNPSISDTSPYSTNPKPSIHKPQFTRPPSSLKNPTNSP